LTVESTIKTDENLLRALQAAAKHKVTLTKEERSAVAKRAAGARWSR